jgi:hypothetical protein
VIARMLYFTKDGTDVIILVILNIPSKLQCEVLSLILSTVKVRLSGMHGEWGVPIDRFCR